MASNPSRSYASSTASSTNSDKAATSRSGYFIRNRLKRLGSYVGETLAGNADDEDAPSPYTEERCLVFPGYAHVSNDNKLQISVEGFAFRLRPLGSASRTQKLFVSAAKQLTSLPRLPRNGSTSSLNNQLGNNANASASQDSLSDLDVELPPQVVKQQAKEYEERIKREQLGEEPISHESEHINPIHQAQGQSTIAGAFRPRRSNTMDSIASNASTASTASVSSSSIVTFSKAPLQTLHDNLHDRLRFFFSQKLVGRRIRVSVYLVPDVPGQRGNLSQLPSTSVSNPSTSSSASEICIAKGTLLTEQGGVFKTVLSVPWTDGDPHRRKLRVRAEILSEIEDETIDDQQGLDAVLKRSDEASVGLSHARTKIRVISDIDDTIKLTHVLAGIRAVLRNVFTRPHDELVVPGMQEWYWKLFDEGASFHYLSNSPYEIFGVLRDYLKVTNFPPGSMRLKEYGGGSSLLGGLWESAASRKRGGAEEILRMFTDSRFLLVGDSGEQDLELYTSLAVQFPEQVLAIYIRDVTTPEPRRLGSNSKNASVESLNTPPNAALPSKGPGRLVRRRSDLEQQAVLARLAKEEAESPLFSSRTLASSQPLEGLDDADEFSPNNPLDRNLPSSGVLDPYDAEGYTEVERKVIGLFRDRIHRAKSQLPKGIKLTIFRTGDTCIEESLRIAGLDSSETKNAQSGSRP